MSLKFSNKIHMETSLPVMNLMSPGKNQIEFTIQVVSKLPIDENQTQFQLLKPET